MGGTHRDTNLFPRNPQPALIPSAHSADSIDIMARITTTARRKLPGEYARSTAFENLPPASGGGDSDSAWRPGMMRKKMGSVFVGGRVLPRLLTLVPDACRIAG
jgi:hypothetical protein